MPYNGYKDILTATMLIKKEVVMKKFIITAVAIGAVVFTGCSSEHTTKYIRNYKITLTPDKELAEAKCFNAKGVFMINQNYIVGEIHSDKAPVTYIDGRYSDKTKEIQFKVVNEKNEYVMIAGGAINPKNGSGNWESVNCYGKWQAKRDD